MGRPRLQAGFTLVEVVAAFVIFALTAAAVNEVLFGALRRTVKSADETGAWLIAQSLRDERASRPQPWPKSDEGESPGGWSWRVSFKPVEGAENSELQTLDLKIEVWRSGSSRPLAVLHSMELARRQQ